MFTKILASIFYIIWIIIGVAILGGIIFMLVFNPFAKIGETFENLTGEGSFFQMMGAPQSGNTGGMEIEEVMKEDLGKKVEECIKEKIGEDRMNAIKSGQPYTPDEAWAIGQCLQQ